MHLSIYLSIHRSTHLSIFQSIHRSIHPSIHLSTYLSTPSQEKKLKSINLYAAYLAMMMTMIIDIDLEWMVLVVTLLVISRFLIPSSKSTRTKSTRGFPTTQPLKQRTLQKRPVDHAVFFVAFHFSCLSQPTPSIGCDLYRRHKFEDL